MDEYWLKYKVKCQFFPRQHFERRHFLRLRKSIPTVVNIISPECFSCANSTSTAAMDEFSTGMFPYGLLPFRSSPGCLPVESLKKEQLPPLSWWRALLNMGMSGHQHSLHMRLSGPNDPPVGAVTEIKVLCCKENGYFLSCDHLSKLWMDLKKHNVWRVDMAIDFSPLEYLFPLHFFKIPRITYSYSATSLMNNTTEYEAFSQSRHPSVKPCLRGMHKGLTGRLAFFSGSPGFIRRAMNTSNRLWRVVEITLTFLPEWAS